MYVLSVTIPDGNRMALYSVLPFGIVTEWTMSFLLLVEMVTEWTIPQLTVISTHLKVY